MYHTAQKTAERAVKMYEIKDSQLGLVTFNMANVRTTHEISQASTSTTRGHFGCIFTAIADCAT